jgi:3-methyladenine DNA glycosylase AlkD
MWTKRAALVATLPWAKMRHPSPEETLARERILGWASTYTTDKQWFIQKAVAWWLRDLSRKDPARVQCFVATNGDDMAGFARKEATRVIAC